MVLQALQPRVHHIVYEMASVAMKPIPLKGGFESLGDVATTIGDNSREVHMQLDKRHCSTASLAMTISTQQCSN